jgi:glycine cleavage system H protein
MELEYPHLQFTEGFWWRRPDGTRVRLGITREAASQLTYVTHLELPPVGARVRAGDPFGVIESQKVVSDLYAPLTGTVVAHNPDLQERPFLVNVDPEGAGWLLLVSPG